MLIRYFAGAADVAGCREETVDLKPGETYAELVQRLASGRRIHLLSVFGIATLLADGERVKNVHSVVEAQTLEVLPPFAGG